MILALVNRIPPNGPVMVRLGCDDLAGQLGLFLCFLWADEGRHTASKLNAHDRSVERFAIRDLWFVNGCATGTLANSDNHWQFFAKMQDLLFMKDEDSSESKNLINFSS